MDTLTAMQQRFSVRSYDERPVDPALRQRLLQFASGARTLTESPLRIELIGGADSVRQVLTFMVGSYGLIRNAPHLIAGIISEDTESARLELGNVLEQVVLEATRLGLGTCWITGTYDAQEAGDVLAVDQGEIVAAVCSLGYPTEEGFGRLHTQLIRRLAGGHKRKPLNQIVFSGRWGEPWSPQDADPALLQILTHARLAPSATNGQPWRFVVEPDRMLLTIVRPRIIDAGIIMSHVTLAAAAVDYEGEWTLCIRNDEISRAFDLPDKVLPIGIFRRE